ncbi:hypothetical protein VF14_29305 [Nostoc linckia z18]|uniref:DUF3598 family protein n=3 Tax=Nostoc linckia TaxID=92942 RepID=A0A9Q6EM75_NOSLI|nr:DUF3598 family protein [Nostoc linckia]PHJ63931.1 hypothetical protein VF02_14165 [Nostoc linckia z1]PHK05427.1 hypothetical protein VF09_26785 [Nostoc linckia z9]PHK30044.1 hypothetical protein VF14_29305 [Nostoc linckia z18]PHK47231.1 hypothetical protein VF13_06900 [Nostoc linckia z16]PHJ69502.1 hypothetical protein VF05_13805 [Nostoc linckia z3]
MNSEIITNAQLINWENFCTHIGDWHGTWNVYNLEGQLIKFHQCVRSFHLNSDGSQMNHQNYSTYVDGTNKLETYGPHLKPHIRSLHFNDSFSWGSSEVKPGSIFFFETGFKHQDRRRSAVARYNENNTLDILIISEHLDSIVNESPLPAANQLSGWQGVITKMTPDFIVSPAVPTAWIQLEDLNKNYLTLHLQDSVSISIPRYIESGTEFFLAVQWLVNPTLLLRGIRHFNISGFTSFNLEKFQR